MHSYQEDSYGGILYFFQRDVCIRELDVCIREMFVLERCLY